MPLDSNANISEIVRQISQCDCEACWWTGTIGFATKEDENGQPIAMSMNIYVVPKNDSMDHFTGDCACKPKHEFTTADGSMRVMSVHNAFDGRE